MPYTIAIEPAHTALHALLSAAVAPSSGNGGWIVAGAVVAGLAGAAWLVYRNLAGREQLERELELLLPGTRVGAGSGDAPPVQDLTAETAGNSGLRERARDSIARDPERAALLLAAWANEADESGPEGRHAAA